jgi:hypothetical protein
MNEHIQALSTASTATSLSSCAAIVANDWFNFLSTQGQLVATVCAVITTLSTITFTFLNYRLNSRKVEAQICAIEEDLEESHYHDD